MTIHHVEPVLSGLLGVSSTPDCLQSAFISCKVGQHYIDHSAFSILQITPAVDEQKIVQVLFFYIFNDAAVEIYFQKVGVVVDWLCHS